MNDAPPVLGLLLIDGFADWEYGLLAASAVQWFGMRTVFLTPGAGPVTSIGGLTTRGERGTDPGENRDLAAVAVIGSDGWSGDHPPDPAALLRDVRERGGVVGGICAGTLALARAGLFEGRAHTSNGRDWIAGHAADYAGADRYRDVPFAVANGGVVSAPGTAPGTFAAEMLAAMHPARRAEVDQARAMFAREYLET